MKAEDRSKAGVVLRACRPEAQRAAWAGTRKAGHAGEIGRPLPSIFNPSTADASLDDPTIRRCMGFARREGAGGIIVTNIYAYRATDPAALWRAADPYGPENDAALTSVASDAARYGTPLVCAWGVHGGHNNRPIVLMLQAGAKLMCLGRTKDGHPRHPLYVKGDQPMEAFR